MMLSAWGEDNSCCNTCKVALFIWQWRYFRLSSWVDNTIEAARMSAPLTGRCTLELCIIKQGTLNAKKIYAHADRAIWTSARK